MSRKSHNSARCGSGADQHARLDHASRSSFSIPPRAQRFEGRSPPDTASLDQLHVHAVKTFRAMRNVFGAVIRPVGKQGQRRAFLQPDEIFGWRGLGHRLFNELMCPSSRASHSMRLSASSLVAQPSFGIHAPFCGRGAAEGGEDCMIVRHRRP